MEFLTRKNSFPMTLTYIMCGVSLRIAGLNMRLMN